jgi:hypothetical protein
VLNDRTINELERIWKEKVVAYVRQYPGIFLKGLRNTMKSLIQESRSLSRYLYPSPTDYDAGTQTTAFGIFQHITAIYYLDFIHRPYVLQPQRFKGWTPIEASSIDWTQQSRFHLMTREEPSLETLWLQNIRTKDKVQIIDRYSTSVKNI